MTQCEAICRICLESSPAVPCPDDGVAPLAEDRLISPCACSGTQAFVHFRCLRRWQNAVMAAARPGASYAAALMMRIIGTSTNDKLELTKGELGKGDRINIRTCTRRSNNGIRCPVCTQKFSVTPPQTGLASRLLKVVGGYSCELTGLMCVLCACYLAFAGLNLQTILDELESGIAMAREILPCSLNINMEEGCLSRMCRMLGSKLGSGRPSLLPGTLLVATAAMPSSFFFGTVVLLYEHKRCSISRGLILNMQLELHEKRIFDWESEVLQGMPSDVLLKRLSHGVGGPVAQNNWMILHRCACCITSSLKQSSCSQWLRKEKTSTENLGRELLPGIFLATDISPVLHYTKEEPPILAHQVLHGHAEWFAGQLGSEVQRGLWLTKPNASEVLLATAPQELWHALIKDQLLSLQ